MKQGLNFHPEARQQYRGRKRYPEGPSEPVDETHSSENAGAFTEDIPGALPEEQALRRNLC